MKKNVFGYVWRHTRRDQLWILAVIAISLPFYFLALELPKQIVDGPIRGVGFASAEGTSTYFRLSVPVPHWFASDGSALIFSGLELTRFDLLLVLSAILVALIAINGLFKFYINLFKGKLGERLLVKLRYELFDRVLRFPSNRFRQAKPAEIATMIKDEVEPLGGFTGNAFAQPVFLAGQALTAMIFILAQNFWLGLIALSIVLLQTFLIPGLRRKLLILGRERQLATRELAGRVGEVVAGIADVHLNDTSNYERAAISQRLKHIFSLRYQIYRRKFLVKFLNNFLAQFTPFLFYFIGGIFALRGELEIGALVAVIAAYKDLPSPIKELIDWDQQRLDAQVKFGQVIEQFEFDGLLDPELQAPPRGKAPRLDGPLGLQNVDVVNDNDQPLLTGASFEIANGERVAAFGRTSSGVGVSAETLARLRIPAAGRVSANGQDLNSLPEYLTGRRIAYVGASPYILNGTVRDNLLYGLMNEADGAIGYGASAVRPSPVTGADNSTGKAASAALKKSRNGGEAHDGGTSPGAIVEVLEIAGLGDVVFDWGLRGTIDPEARPEIASKLVDARHSLAKRLSKLKVKGRPLVEPYAPGRYNNYASVLENLLYSAIDGNALAAEELTHDPYLLETLSSTGTGEKLLAAGQLIAATFLEVIEDLSAENKLLQRIGLISHSDLPAYAKALSRSAKSDWASIDASDRSLFLRLVFAYEEPVHRLGIVDAEFCKAVVRARQEFLANLPARLRGKVHPYDRSKFLVGRSVLSNLLFGRVVVDRAGAEAKVMAELRRTLVKHDLTSDIYQVGLDFEVGPAGSRLSDEEAQKLGLARALLKDADYLIVNRGLSALDQADQRKILSSILRREAERKGSRRLGIYWVNPDRGELAKFDRVLRFEDGHIVANDPARERSRDRPDGVPSAA